MQIFSVKSLLIDVNRSVSLNPQSFDLHEPSRSTALNPHSFGRDEPYVVFRSDCKSTLYYVILQYLFTLQYYVILQYYV